jgi:hypothetical protein
MPDPLVHEVDVKVGIVAAEQLSDALARAGADPQTSVVRHSHFLRPVSGQQLADPQEIGLMPGRKVREFRARPNPSL